jgi:eukaryotic translation initiation factor 2C
LYLSPSTASLSQPDPQVQQVENEIQASCQKINPSPSTKHGVGDKLPLRAGYGTQGRPVVLLANYFQLVASPELLLFRYNIEILPDEKGKKPAGRKLKRIIELFLEEHISPGRKDVATDYKSLLLCRSALIHQKEYPIRYRSEGEDEPSPRATSYRLRLQDAGTLHMSQLIDFMTSSNASALFDSKDELIQALNIVLGHHPKSVSSIVSVGANKHFDSAPAQADSRNLGAGLTAIRGLFVSVRAATSRLLVNVQVKHAAFYNAVTLDALMLEYKRENGPNVVKLGNFLKKLRVQVTHIVTKNKNGTPIPRIKTITYLATPQDGSSLQHRPIVPFVGAGAKDVKFHLESAAAPGDIQGPGQAKKGSKPSPMKGSSASQEGYISVYDYFKRCKDVVPLLWAIC